MIYLGKIIFFLQSSVYVFTLYQFLVNLWWLNSENFTTNYPCVRAPWVKTRVKAQIRELQKSTLAVGPLYNSWVKYLVKSIPGNYKNLALHGSPSVMKGLNVC